MPALRKALSSPPLTLALALENTWIKVNAVCRGFVSTALNNFNGTRRLEEGAGEPVQLR